MPVPVTFFEESKSRIFANLFNRARKTLGISLDWIWISTENNCMKQMLYRWASRPQQRFYLSDSKTLVHFGHCAYKNHFLDKSGLYANGSGWKVKGSSLFQALDNCLQLCSINVLSTERHLLINLYVLSGKESCNIEKMVILIGQRIPKCRKQPCFPFAFHVFHIFQEIFFCPKRKKNFLNPNERREWGA